MILEFFGKFREFLRFFLEIFWKFFGNFLEFFLDFFGDFILNSLGILWEYGRNWFVCEDFGFCQDFVSMEKEEGRKEEI